MEWEDPQLVLHWHYDPNAASNPGVPNTGALPANIPITPNVSAIGGEVPSDEVWELLCDPVISFDGGGLVAGTAPTDFALQVQIDQGTGQQGTLAPWGYWRGAPDLNPDTPGMWTVDADVLPSLKNAGALAAVRAARNPQMPVSELVAIMARTYKAATTFNFTLTPLAAVDSIIDMKWYGRRWSRQAFAYYLAGQQPVSGQYSLTRHIENMAISFPLSFPPLSFDSWNQQPGGASQPTTQAWPFRTVAINTVASTLNTRLILAWNGGQSGQAQVENQYENLSFQYNPRTGVKNVLDVDSWSIATRWQYRTNGVGTNLRYAGLYAENDVVSKFHPPYLRLVTDNDNPYMAGIQQGIGPADYRSRRVDKWKFPIFGDYEYFFIQDNGLGTIAANTIATWVRGTMVTQYPYPGNAQVTRQGQPV
jgi:hypothetical protein